MSDMKQCMGPCRRVLSNTIDNFELTKGRDTLRSKCRSCRNTEKRRKQENTDKSLKYCTGFCGQFLPATSEYFYPSKVNKDGWQGWCKNCRYQHSKNNSVAEGVTIAQLAKRVGVTHASIQGLINSGVLQAFKVPSKDSPKNGEWRISLEDADMYVLIASRDLPKGEVDIINFALEVDNDAGMILGTPDQCGACGVTRRNILGDVNEATHKRYGFLCTRCHRLVQDFHEDMERMHKVLNYLEKTRPNQV